MQGALEVQVTWEATEWGRGGHFPLSSEEIGLHDAVEMWTRLLTSSSSICMSKLRVMACASDALASMACLCSLAISSFVRRRACTVYHIDASQAFV